MAGRVRKVVDAVEELCREHFPEGWDSAHIHATHRSVSCEHGEWSREIGERAAQHVTPTAGAEQGRSPEDGDNDPDANEA
jgi:hypothetical protein